ncbi:transglutaminaseTgpA domain-containing protein [Agromyces sp. NPDC058110]|uniref:transglutaminase family protein n=1 Tax=Agromyces sp. NPDC058110 TaxID=3346345 RepID=UPI0036D810A7
MRPDSAALTLGGRLALTAASFLLMVIATMSLGPLIAGGGWWWLCAFVSAGVFFGGAGLRALRLPSALVPLLECVVLLLLLTLLFGGATSIAFIVPTPDTFGVFGELFTGSQRTIAQQTVPAVAVPALGFALALGVGVLSILLDVLVQVARVPALAAVPAFVPVVIPGFLVEDGAEIPVLVCTAAAYLLLLRIDVRVSRRARMAAGGDEEVATVSAPKRVPVASTLGASLGVAATGLVVASVLAASTPSIATSLLLGNGSQGALFARGVSPFIDLGRDLRRPEARPAFRYLARDGDRPNFTLLTLDRFEGDVWAVTEAPVDGDNTVDEIGAPEGLGPEVATSEHPIDVLVSEVRTTWLPVPYPSTKVDGLSGSWYWDDGPLTVRSVDTNTAGQSYEVTRLEVEPTVEQLRTAGPAQSVDAKFLDLPDEVPAIITDTAAELAGTAATPYDAAVAIQAFLRSSAFQYSTEAPVEEGYDGGGFDVIASFLEAKSGYCVHFASTMAVLAREAGIPSRISVGYTSGSPTTERVDGVQRVEVDSHDLHAWPELYFEGVGWVPFEPTPGRGAVPEYSRPGAGQSQTSVLPNAPATTAPATGRPELDPDRGLAGGTSGQGQDAAPLRAAVLLIAVVALLLLPAALRMLQRATRRRRIRAGRAPADAAWDELIATARDLGIEGAAVVTPRGFAARLAERPALRGAEPLAALVRLRDAVERERYGPGAGGAVGDTVPVDSRSLETLRHDLDLVCRGLATDARPAERVRATLVPMSLADGIRRASGVRTADGA